MEKEVSNEESKEDWLKAEEESIQAPEGDFERLPTPVFEDGKITTIVVDFSEPFNKWTDPETKKTKAIVPCISEVESKMQKCNWWVNLKNPIYREIIRKGRAAENKAEVEIRIIQTGTKGNTRYSIIKE